MPAAVEITINNQKQTVPLSGNVARIGEGPTCDINLPGPAHAATISLHKTGGRLFNRAGMNVRIQRTEISRGQTGDWPFEARATIGMAQLKLVQTVPAALSPTIATAAPVQTDARSTLPVEQKETAPSLARNPQAWVIAVCVMLLPFLLWLSSDASNTQIGARRGSNVQQLEAYAAEQPVDHWSRSFLEKVGQFRLAIEFNNQRRAQLIRLEAERLVTNHGSLESEPWLQMARQIKDNLVIPKRRLF